MEPNVIDFVSLFLYAEQHIASHPDERRYSRSLLWVPTSSTDIKKFSSLYLLTRIIQKPSLSQYWSTDPLLQTSVFNHIMSRNRFQMILQFIHFADNSLYDRKDPNRNRLYKVQFSSSCSTNLNLFMYLLSLYLLMKSSCFGKVG